MAWRLAKSLETLRAEVNGFAPRRSKASDGTRGDPAHQLRASRHNENRYGVVTALDLTHDPANGCDIHAIARRLVLNPHPELEYVISNRQVAKRRNGFRWEPYTGSNGHTLHAHFAVGTGPDSDPLPPYDSTLSWGVSLQPEADMPLSDEDIRKVADVTAKVVLDRLGLELDDERAEEQAGHNRRRDTLAALFRRVLGVPVMAEGAEQHKADEDTGRRFQNLLGDA